MSGAWCLGFELLLRPGQWVGVGFRGRENFLLSVFGLAAVIGAAAGGVSALA